MFVSTTDPSPSSRKSTKKQEWSTHFFFSMDSFLPVDIAVFHLLRGLISSERLIMVSL